MVVDDVDDVVLLVDVTEVLASLIVVGAFDVRISGVVARELSVV